MRIDHINNKIYTETPKAYLRTEINASNTYNNNYNKLSPLDHQNNSPTCNDVATQNQRTYHVKAGDNLSRIARSHLIDWGYEANNNQIYSLVDVIVRENRLENPDIINPGQTIKIPIPDLQRMQNNEKMQHAHLDNFRNSLHHLTALTTLSIKNDSEILVPMHHYIHNEPSHKNQDAKSVVSQKQLPSGGPYQSGLPLENYRQPKLFPLPNWKQLQYTNKLESHNTSANNTTVRESRINKVESSNRLKSLDINNSNNEYPWMRVLPETAVLTSEFGSRRDPFTGERSFHNGIDIAAEHGTPIRAYSPGTVVFSGWQSGYGKVIIIRHDDGHESVYGHNAKNLVRAGERVNDDSVIGLIGTTGRSTGPHLHFEIRVEGKAVNPIPFLTGDTSQYRSAAL